MKTILRGFVALALICLSGFSIAGYAAPQGEGSKSSTGSVITGKLYTFQPIADGVYYTTSSGSMNTGGNHTIIVGDRDVVLVDAGTTPPAARALLEDIKLITNKPIRIVINTHFHWDHTGGNTVFGPEVEIIGHDYIPYALKTMAMADIVRPPVTRITNLAESLKKQLSTENDPKRREAIQKQIDSAQADLDQIKILKLIPPTITYSTKLTIHQAIHQGEREIQLLYLGKGHTQGDTVVYLPKERIVCTGDLMESRVAALVDGVFDDWIKSLGALKELDFDTVLPGHGTPFHDKALITAFQDYLRDFVAQVTELRKQGLSAEEAAKKVDLTSHKKDFPEIQGPGVDVNGVRQAYALMDKGAR